MESVLLLYRTSGLSRNRFAAQTHEHPNRASNGALLHGHPDDDRGVTASGKTFRDLILAPCAARVIDDLPAEPRVAHGLERIVLDEKHHDVGALDRLMGVLQPKIDMV